MRDILSIYFNKFSDDIKTIVHVGAHFGQEVEFYKTHKPNEIHLFEPNPSVFKKLEKNIEKFQNVSIYNFALGSNQDFVNFYVSNENDGESSSILEPSGHLIAKPEISFHLSSEKVQVQRFDYFGISNIDFVNIDTQGYELEVIKGFGEELKNIKFLHCEINRNYVYKNNTLVNDLDSYLDKNNFIRVNTNWGKYNEPYGNAIYLNKKFLKSNTIYFHKLINRYQNSNIYYFLRIFTNYSRFKYYLKKLLKLLKLY
tara:strand:+ start:3058 stop:3825 length:768 start_codon:yes stop_codon:yes gene_type:complete